MPRWGLTAEDATILEWMVGEGDEVREGEVLVTVETDKATGEVEAPASGRLARVLVSEGATVRPGDVLAEIES
jgi:pyruvate dehydrogenase E2 component (dihydrolipoamide acetyltransferase)